MTDMRHIGVTTPAMHREDTPAEKARRTAAMDKVFPAPVAPNATEPSDLGHAPPGCRIVGKISEFSELQAEIRKGIEDGTLTLS